MLQELYDGQEVQVSRLTFALWLCVCCGGAVSHSGQPQSAPNDPDVEALCELTRVQVLPAWFVSSGGWQVVDHPVDGWLTTSVSSSPSLVRFVRTQIYYAAHNRESGSGQTHWKNWKRYAILGREMLKRI